MAELIPAPEFNKVGMSLSVTPNQRNFLKSIRENTVTICHGPAGTGKTFVAIAEGIRALNDKKSKTQKIIFIRPAVTAQEEFGFLPGDLNEKLDPFLDPFWDSVDKLMNEKLVGIKDLIEIRTFAYMRGLTFENAFIVVDEAQNTTKDQIKLVLSRLGKGAKMVICGDTNQLDIKESKSGLADAINRLEGVAGLNIAKLTKADNMRNGIVKRILERYEGVDPEEAAEELKNNIDEIFPGTEELLNDDSINPQDIECTDCGELMLADFCWFCRRY